ncbi:AAA family ATPase [Actinacidiphila acidipaludis]|uniref:AAA family ATPase n=1 Tax=Actinacidiphila acidipaludis TaxID=2873382 RepID=A0ABS7Q3K5_9ACTN|nr:AAA family ATPase [Streptomyces acidipaludis]MBY8877279.1 AAA family ATPase [Streptomyces acidipaludis]
MRLGISGTYSSGKTLTALALSHYTGLPRTTARTMREILPDAAPGKTLEECTAAELLQMIVVRHTERVKYEHQLAAGFVSDGSSLQEWIYGALRVKVGINPNDSAALGDRDVERTAELAFFDDVMRQLGVSFKQHVQRGFDAFVHLRNELPLSADGHRPVNDRFRTMADARLLEVLDELRIPVHVVSGTLPERLRAIAAATGLRPVTTEDQAVAAARAEYQRIDTTIETRRTAAPTGRPPVHRPVARSRA